jgi:DNA-directed RNA polymerase specialized sigma subunit
MKKEELDLVRELLKNYQLYKARIRLLEICAEELDTLKTSALPAEKRLSYHNHHSSVERVALKKTEIEKEKAYCERMCEMIDIAVSNLTPFSQTLIKKRYFDNLTWQEVGDETGWSYSKCNSCGKEALIEIHRVLFGDLCTAKELGLVPDDTNQAEV